MKDASLPVPDEQPVIKRFATLSCHTNEIADYFMFAVTQIWASGLFQMEDAPVGGKGM